MDWTDLARDRDKQRALVNAVMNLYVLYNDENLPSRETISFSRSVLYGISILAYILMNGRPRGTDGDG